MYNGRCPRDGIFDVEWVVVVLSKIELENMSPIVSGVWHITDDWKAILLHDQVGLDDVAALGFDSGDLVEVVDIVGSDGWHLSFVVGFHLKV